MGPRKICKKYCIGLHKWLNKLSSSVPFAVPIIWRKSKHHRQDCYFSLTKTKGFYFKQRKKVAHPNLDLARIPAPHDESTLPKVFLKMGFMLLIAVLIKTILTNSFLPTLQILSTIPLKITSYFYKNI